MHEVQLINEYVSKSILVFQESIKEDFKQYVGTLSDIVARLTSHLTQSDKQPKEQSYQIISASQSRSLHKRFTVQNLL